jgi:hypothetical protein
MNVLNSDINTGCLETLINEHIDLNLNKKLKKSQTNLIDEFNIEVITIVLSK